jgi:hypothetical protein
MRVHRSVIVAAAIVVLQMIPGRAEDAPKQPELVVEQQGRVTNIRVGGASWSGIIKEVEALRALPADKDGEVIDKLQKELDTNPPAYIYELTRRVCRTDPQRAVDLFALAWHRIRYDAVRCVDKSARAGVYATFLSLPLQECRALDDNRFVRPALEKVLNSSDLFASKASPWWICSHGMQAIMAAMEKKTLQTSDWLKPESEWPAIRQEILGQIDAEVKKRARD